MTKETFLDLWERFKELRSRLSNNEITIMDDGDFITSNEQLLDFLIPENKEEQDINISNLSDLYTLLENLSKIKENDFNLTFQIKNIKNRTQNVLKVSSIKLSNNNKCILELEFKFNKAKDQYSDVIIKSEFISSMQNLFAEESKKILKIIQYDSTLFHIFSRDKNNLDNAASLLNPISIPLIINKIFSYSLDALRQNFGGGMINYVSPLRAHPQRYYFLDKAKINISLDTLDGNSLTEILKENTPVKKRVNEWFKKFDLAVNVFTLEDVIHKLKVKQNGLSLDITDVGFGISQILPVIVQGFLSASNSLTIIEQPEIHLHPKMQADLADLFIDIIYSNSKQKASKFLIIETHSEYMLKRLRRRLAEKEKVKTSDVGIHFFEPKEEDKCCSIQNKQISDEGAFEWPKNFYSGELLKDTVEFIKERGFYKL